MVDLTIMRLLFLFIIPLIILNASDVYVKVGEAKSKRGLSYAYSKLNKMDMKMFYKTSIRDYETVYTVYTGPYRTKKNQSIALKNVRYFFKGAKLIKFTSSSVISDLELQDVKVNKNIRIIKSSNNLAKQNKNKFSLGFALGYATAPSSHVISSGTVTIVKPNNSGIDYLLNARYDLSQDYLISLNYMRMDADDLVFDNFYASLGYKFSQLGNFAPHFGISLGMSALTWHTSPLAEVSASSNNNSETLLYGTELGLTYKGYKNLLPFIQYHCMFMNHTTNLTQDASNTSKLQHKTLHALLLGIGYSF